MYEWRKMTENERLKTLSERKWSGRPWHSPPYRNSGGGTYLFTAACFEHRPVIGDSRERMENFVRTLLRTLGEGCSVRQIHAWVVLPNHYHLLGDIPDVMAVKKQLGEVHGRTSHEWNRQESLIGRKVWFRALETKIKNDRHFWATVNYIHQNPIKHRCVSSLQDWPWSSFPDWMEERGRDSLEKLWNNFPTDQYGERWDDEDLSIVARNLLE